MAPAPLTAPDTAANLSPGIDLPLRKMSNTVLALDLGTTTGWALRLGDRSILSGIQTFRPGRFEGSYGRNWVMAVRERRRIEAGDEPA
jgi:hypothetical protein